MYYKQIDGISKIKSKGHALLQNVFDGLVGRLYPAKKNISKFENYQPNL